MAKASQTIISQSSKKTLVSITPKFIPGTEETNGVKRCPNCGKFMR